LHGVPGTPAELTLGKGGSWTCNPAVFAPDRNRLARECGSKAHFQNLADEIGVWSADQPIRLVGFSLGAAVALRVAALLGPSVEQIDLIAPAAPLSLGDFLRSMAGGALFGMARDHPWRFRLACWMQGRLAQLSPKLLAQAILAGCKGGDKTLATEAGFRDLIARMLADTFAEGAQSYQTEVTAYAGNWEDCLSAVSQPVEIWQGDQDNWVPPEMAAALAGRLAGLRELHKLPGLSHYSALAWYLGRFRPGDNPL
jgi:pimeloyl-ACP methyl ester carboxylesterase